MSNQMTRREAEEQYEKLFDLARYFEMRMVMASDDGERQWCQDRCEVQEEAMRKLEPVLWTTVHQEEA